MSKLPLDGIRVFDFTLWMVGPWASTQLGALGADVIHVERPDVSWESIGAGVPPTISGTSIGYIAWNFNKRGLSLDMTAPGDQATALELLKTCDVFMNNFRPGTAARLGVDYETVSQINPQIVYCAMSGWGESGPMRDDPGADTQMRYFTGYHSGTGTPDGEDEIDRFTSSIDGTTGNQAVQAILMGLLARKRTGRGQRIHVSMLRSSATLQTVRLGEFLTSGREPARLGTAAQSTAPDRAFECENERYLGISVTSEQEWQAFCTVVERPDLLDDERFRSNSDRVAHRSELDAILEPVLLAKPVNAWILKFRQAGVPHGYPMTWEEIRHHEQVLANRHIIEVETPAWGNLLTGGPPWHFSDTPARWFSPPMPGEHTEDILAELETRGSERRAPAEVGD